MSLNLFMFFVFTFIAGAMLSAKTEGTTSLATTSLTATLSDGSDSETSPLETISVHSTSGFNDRGVLVIDNETIQYTGITATSFTGLTRGARKTSATEHPATKDGLTRRVYSEAPGIVNTLVGFDIASGFTDGGIVGLAKGTINTFRNFPDFVGAMARIILWDWSYLEGPYVYLKYLLLYPLSAGMVLSGVRMALGR